MNAIEGRVIRDRTLSAAPGLAPLGAAPLWGIAAPAGIHPGIGVIVLVLVVLGSLGFGLVRLNARRAAGAGRPAEASRRERSWLPASRGRGQPGQLTREPKCEPDRPRAG